MAVVALVAGRFQPLEQVEPRSPSASIIESPAWPSASVMCSPFSVSVRVTRCATSLTLLGDQIADRGDVVGRGRDARRRWRCAPARPGRPACRAGWSSSRAGRGCALRCRYRRARARRLRCAPATSSSAARASARSTPSPMAATSRRIAWPTRDDRVARGRLPAATAASPLRPSTRRRCAGPARGAPCGRAR